MAKGMGMRVDEFGIGFPPRLFRYKKGDTLYCLNTIPLGGYVKIHGENPEEIDEDPRSFQHKSVLARFLVVVAGVIMNLVFAFVVLTIAYSLGFISAGQELETVPGAVVKDSKVLIVAVTDGSPAAAAGVQSGDLLKFLADQKGQVTSITSVSELQEITKKKQESGDRNLTIMVERNGNQIKRELTLNASGLPLGVSIQPINTVRVPLLYAPKAALVEIGYIISVTWEALRNFVSRFFYEAKLDQSVSGPVGIYQATAVAVKQGIIPIIFLMVALSVNLALLNILPIPALDGGKLVFLLTEAVFRKRVITERLENYLSLLGLMALLSLILLVTFKDIQRFF